MSRQEQLQEESGRQALADLEASSRLCLAALPALGLEAETLASQAHGLLLEAQLEQRRPYVTVRLRAADARVAGLALSPAGKGSSWEERPEGALARAGGKLTEAGWSKAPEQGPRSVEELAELEVEQLETQLSADRQRGGQEPPAADSLGLGPREREALRWLTEGGHQEAEELPDDYVMTVQQVVGRAVEQLAGALEELYVNAVAVGDEPDERISYDGWRRVAAAALTDDLEPALGSLPLGEGDAV